LFGDVILFLFLVFGYKGKRVNDWEKREKMGKTEIKVKKLDRFVKLGKRYKESKVSR